MFVNAASINYSTESEYLLCYFTDTVIPHFIFQFATITLKLNLNFQYNRLIIIFKFQHMLMLHQLNEEVRKSKTLMYQGF